MNPILAHEGHTHSLWQQIGEFHFIFLHFPIALFLMTAMAEILYLWSRSSLFNHAARFMLVAGAMMAIPTVAFGLILGSVSHYEGHFAVLYEWHKIMGLSTATLAIFCAILRETYGLNVFYYFLLALLFLSVNVTGFLGGEMTFGEGLTTESTENTERRV